MMFDLWDVQINRYLGQYEDESEALALVLTLVKHYGPAYADDLELGGITAEGEVLESISGATLIARADEILSRRQTDPGKQELSLARKSRMAV